MRSNLTRVGVFISEELVPYFRARNKKPFRNQITEMNGLYKKYNSLPYQYFKSKLYSLGAPEDIENYIPPKLIAKLQNRLNDISNSRYAHDKHAFRVYMESNGLPVIREIFRILPSGLIQDSDHNEITRSVAERLLAVHGKDVFVKPTRGSYGEGAFVHEMSRPVDYLFESFTDVLVQPVITQHESIKVLHPHSLNTVRIDTLLYNGKCINNAAVLKVGVDEMVVDNLKAGSLVAGIDMETGRLFPRAMQRAKFSSAECDRHPNTGVPFESVTIPYWRDVIDLTREAANTLPKLRTLGWDVAITPTGPLLVEVNINWDVNLMQDAWGGMGATRIGRFAQELSRA